MDDPERRLGCRKYWTPALSWRLLVPMLLLAAMSGCTPPGEGPVSVAQAFHAALDGHDLESACELLSPVTAKSVAMNGSGSCPTGIKDAGLAAASLAGHSSSATEVFGRSALVTFGEENLFLTRSGTRWLVNAAGCKAVDGAPYDCEIGGS